MKVGVIGLGTMGMGAALNLHRKGHTVTGCEPREASRVEFAGSGAAVVATADALPADLEAVVVFVINAAQTEDVLFGPHGCLAYWPKAPSSCVAPPSPPIPPALWASALRTRDS